MDLTTLYNWGYKTGAKQQHGSYKNGRSLHAVIRRHGTSGEDAYPDYLVWVDEHAGFSAALQHEVAYPSAGKNPATHAVFVSDARAEGTGKFWWVMGGRADTQPFDLVRSLQPFDPTQHELALDDFVTEPQSTTPGLAIVRGQGVLAYRQGSSASTFGRIRFQNYFLPNLSPPQLRFARTLGRASATSPFGSMTLEQLWTRWDPRKQAFGVTWQWFAHETATGTAYGSNPFLYTDDFGSTWKSADGAPISLPLEYATASADPTITPYEHFSRGEDTGWLPRDLGFTPNGAPWMTLVTGSPAGSVDGWRLTFFRWGGRAWQDTVITHAMQGDSDAVACGPVRDYLVCAYSELATPGKLLVRSSGNDGRTWSPPVIVDDVGRSSSDGLQRISWVSFAQPADRYLDNTARFFLGYYRIDDAEGATYKNRMRWVRVHVGPRADFNGDGVADANDEAAFAAAFAQSDSRADFNDDGLVDTQDQSEFSDALAGIESAVGWVSAASLGFGDRMLDVAAPGQAVTVTNTGTKALVIRSISISGSGRGHFSHNSGCPDRLEARNSCSVTVVFRPTETGDQSANLVVALGGDAGNRTVNLTGNGVDYSYRLSPTSLAFGNVASGSTSAAMNATIKNLGTVALPLASIGIKGNNPAQFPRTHDCPGQLLAGESCAVEVRFRPTSTGNKSATLVVSPGNGARVKFVELTGTGT